MRCGPLVLATLANLYLDTGLAISLFDANEERLDLMDLLARKLFEGEEPAAIVRSTAVLGDALTEATDIVLCMSEDCCRRMTSPLAMPSLENFVPFDDPTEIRRGDYNRPTPVDELSAHTRSMMERPVDLLSQGSARDAAVRWVMELAPTGTKLVNLMGDLSMPVLDESRLDWPPEMSEAELTAVPHQILRWIRDDDPIHTLYLQGEGNPLYDRLGR